MFTFTSETNIVIQALILAIIIGVFYNFWVTTRTYGGIIGRAIRLLGIGLLFITVAVLEKMMVNFNVIPQSPNFALLQDVLNLIGLFFLARGFSVLGSASKA